MMMNKKMNKYNNEHGKRNLIKRTRKKVIKYFSRWIIKNKK